MTSHQVSPFLFYASTQEHAHPHRHWVLTINIHTWGLKKSFKFPNYQENEEKKKKAKVIKTLLTSVGASFFEFNRLNYVQGDSNDTKFQ